MLHDLQVLRRYYTATRNEQPAPFHHKIKWIMLVDTFAEKPHSSWFQLTQVYGSYQSSRIML